MSSNIRNTNLVSDQEKSNNVVRKVASNGSIPRILAVRPAAKRVISADSVANQPVPTNEENPVLNRIFSHGYSEFTKSKNWKQIVDATIHNVGEAWQVINNTFGSEGSSMRQGMEQWIFQNGLIPHQELVKEKTGSKELYELTFGEPTIEEVVIIVMLMIGETLPFSEKVVGVKIKPNNYGGDVRLWIISRNSVEPIRKMILETIKKQNPMRKNNIESIFNEL